MIALQAMRGRDSKIMLSPFGRSATDRNVCCYVSSGESVLILGWYDASRSSYGLQLHSVKGSAELSKLLQ
jgi:hypothetical protein